MRAFQQARYHPVMMTLHWLIFILFAAMYLIIQIRDYLPHESPMRIELILLHKSLGVVIFALAICRLFAKWVTAYPPIVPAQGLFTRTLASLGHIALYAAMIIMPLSGYIMSEAGGRPVALFGMMLPDLIGKHEALGFTMYSTHALISKLIYFLVALHVLAALWHHFIRRDNTVRRMMPGK